MEINENCPCKRMKCERRKNCDACREHHHAMKRKLGVACERRQKKEKGKKQE